MDKHLKKDIKKYCDTIKKALNCPKSMKYAFVTEFRSRVLEFVDEHENTSISDIEKHFGTSESIAKSFYSIDDMTILRKKAKKYIFYKVLAVVLFLLLIVIVYILVDTITHDHTITITTIVDS